MGKRKSKKNRKSLAKKKIRINLKRPTQEEEADINYYKATKGILPPPDAYHFVPSDEIVILQQGTKHWQRCIFPEDGEYLDFEEQKYAELEDYLEENNIELPGMVSKSDLMRFLQANHYKPNKTIDDLLAHLEWRKNTLPIVLTSVQKKFLDEGLFYLHGRDKHFRPLNVFDPRKIIGKNANRDEVIMIVHFVLQYLIDNMLVPGKIENWVGLMDLSNLSISKLPKQWLKEFIKSCQSNYKCRGAVSFLLNASWGLMTLWKVAQVFVDSKVKQKVKFYNKSNPDQLVNMFHPSQLEKKFGGEAENLTVFWPPKEISTEYGVDPESIVRPSESEEANLEFSDDDDVSPQNSHQMFSSNILGDTIQIKNKLNPYKIEEVKGDDSESVCNKQKQSSDSYEESKGIVPESSIYEQPSRTPNSRVRANDRVFKKVDNAQKKNPACCVIF